MLFLLGHSLNVMTLGGLALAVGILVDDATVEIENIHRNLGLGKPLRQAILDGAMQIAGPTFVSTLTISIVFVSVLFLDGPAQVPVHAAGPGGGVRHAGVVPAVADDRADDGRLPAARRAGAGTRRRAPAGSAASCRRSSGVSSNSATPMSSLLQWNLRHRLAVFVVFALVVAQRLRRCCRGSGGTSFPPSIRASSACTCGRRPARGSNRPSATSATWKTRSARSFPSDEVELVLDNIGLPNRTYAMAFGDSATTGMADGEILVALAHHRSQSTPAYIAESAARIARAVSAADVLLPAGRHRQPDPELRPAGPDRHPDRRPRIAQENYEMATEIAERIRQIRGVQDVHLHQVVNVPKLHVDVDQTRARELGLTQQDVANSLLVSLSGSGQVQPNYWVDPNMGISYLVETRTPTYKLDSVDAIERLPLTSPQAQGRAALVERRHGRAGRHAGSRQPHERAADVRRLCQRAGARPGQRGPRNQQGARRVPGEARRRATRIDDARPGRKHGVGVRAARPGDRVRRGAGLPADGREFPELARSVHHHHGPARGVRRHRLVAVPVADDVQRAGLDGGDHVDRRGDGQQHSAGHVRQRAARRRQVGASTPRWKPAAPACGRC